MPLSDEFMKNDGTYSWILLVIITLTNICTLGYLFGTVGVFAERYPHLLNEDISVTNVIGSALIGAYLFSGK